MVSWWVRQKVLIPIWELQEDCVGSGKGELDAEPSRGVTGHLLHSNPPIYYREIKHCLDSVVRTESLEQVRVTAVTGKLPQKCQSEVSPDPCSCQASREPLRQPWSDGTKHRGHSSSVPAPRAVVQWEMWKHKWLLYVQATGP